MRLTDEMLLLVRICAVGAATYAACLASRPEVVISSLAVYVVVESISLLNMQRRRRLYRSLIQAATFDIAKVLQSELPKEEVRATLWRVAGRSLYPVLSTAPSGRLPTKARLRLGAGLLSQAIKHDAATFVSLADHSQTRPFFEQSAGVIHAALAVPVHNDAGKIVGILGIDFAARDDASSNELSNEAVIAARDKGIKLASEYAGVLALIDEVGR